MDGWIPASRETHAEDDDDEEEEGARLLVELVEKQLATRRS